MAQRARAGLARDDLAAGRARPHSPWSAGGWQVLRAGVALLLVACTTQPALIPPTTTPHSSPAATRPTLSPPLPTPPLPPPTAAPIELPGFVTALAPDPGAPWTAIVWRRLAADDPLGGVRSVVRWREGFLAIGAVAVTGETSATPVWISADGGTWRRLGPDVLGPATIVLGAGDTAGGLVALTIQGGRNVCGGSIDGDVDCVELSPPLQAWASADGVAWTPHPQPRLELVEACEGCGFEPPVFLAGSAGLLAMTGYVEAATSPDGVDWEFLESGTIPAAINPGSVVAFGSGFAGVGERDVTVDGTKTRKPIAITSANGRGWTVHPIPVEDFDARSGAFAGRLVAGPDGLIARGGTGGAPGFELWWSSRDGVRWTQLSDYPPLGAWVGEALGSGISPNGTLIGNGDRMLAYRANAPETAWTSSDGASWLPLAIEGDRPIWKGTDTQYPELILTPAGILGFGRDGAAWFGEPRTD